MSRIRSRVLYPLTALILQKMKGCKSIPSNKVFHGPQKSASRRVMWLCLRCSSGFVFSCLFKMHSETWQKTCISCLVEDSRNLAEYRYWCYFLVVVLWSFLGTVTIGLITCLALASRQCLVVTHDSFAEAAEVQWP